MALEQIKAELSRLIDKVLNDRADQIESNH